MDNFESRRASVPPSTPRFHQVFRRMNDPHVFMDELLREHGDVMRWRAFFDVYLLNHPDHVRRVLAQEHECFSKNTVDYRVLTQLMGHGLITSEGVHWAKQRKLIQPMFSSRNVNRFDEVINGLTRGLLDDWERRTAQEPLWIDREMNRLAFQIASETLFGWDSDRYADEMVAILMRCIAIRNSGRTRNVSIPSVSPPAPATGATHTLICLSRPARAPASEPAWPCLKHNWCLPSCCSASGSGPYPATRERRLRK